MNKFCFGVIYNGRLWGKELDVSALNDTGYPHNGRADKYSYPHDGRADKDSYPHDGRAEKDSYPHDRHNLYLMLSLYKFMVNI